MGKRRRSRYLVWQGGEIVSSHRTYEAAEKSYIKNVCSIGLPGQIYDQQTGEQAEAPTCPWEAREEKREEAEHQKWLEAEDAREDE